MIYDVIVTIVALGSLYFNWVLYKDLQTAKTALTALATPAKVA